MKDVRVKINAGKSQTVSVKNNGTVQDVLEKLGINPAHYAVRMNGRSVGLEDLAKENSLLTLAEKVKGGRYLHYYLKGNSPFRVPAL